MAVRNQINELKAKHTEAKALLDNLKYSQIDNYVHNNVTNFSEALEAEDTLSKIVLYNIRH